MALPASAATVDGTAGDDVLVGTHQGDRIHGFGGYDMIEARLGADRVSGGPGDDVIHLGRNPSSRVPAATTGSGTPETTSSSEALPSTSSWATVGTTPCGLRRCRRFSRRSRRDHHLKR